MAGRIATKTNAALTATIVRIRQSMSDSEAPNPVSGKSHSKELLRVRPIWTEYSTACARYMAPPKSQLTTPSRDCWVFKQAGKLIAENNDKGLHSDDEEETRPPNNRGQKGFPPQVRTVNMIYATHIPKRERKHALRDVYAMEPVAPKFNPWSSCPITFDRRDHPTSIRRIGSRPNRRMISPHKSPHGRRQ